MTDVHTSTMTASAAASIPAPNGAKSAPLIGAWRDLRAWLAAIGCGPSKLALFVLVDLLIVGLTLIAGVAARYQDPDLFTWGKHLLSAQRGAWMTGSLLAGGLVLAAAAHLAYRGHVRRSAIGLLVAVLAGGAFVSVAAIDYQSKAARRLVPTKRFKPNERYVARRFGVRLPRDWGTAAAAASPAPAEAGAAPAVRNVSAANGRTLFLRTCASCHGMQGEGITGSGLELRTSTFVAERDDKKLAGFLKVGRQPWDADNVTKVQMPARGGDPRITDDDLRDIVAYLRELQKHSGATAGAQAQDPSGAAGASGAPSGSSPMWDFPEESPLLVAFRTYTPDAQPGPSGLSLAYLTERVRPVWAIPANAKRYFGLYFTFTGVAGLHVVAALLGAVAVLVMSLRRRTQMTARPAMVLATIAWWWATGCWVLIAGMLYVRP